MDADPEANRGRLVETLRRKGAVTSASVARAIATVPRHLFVPEEVRDRAYVDEPLDIGEGQVVTAPHLVARMAELLELRPDLKLLEIGTGSGYHAAVFAELVGPENVYSVERFDTLAERARKVLDEAGYEAVTVTVGDGSRGLPEHAPFDRISVAAASPDVPQPLVEQLADGGRMVIPIGRDSQSLVLVEKRDGRVERTTYDPVRFVPLVGEYGFEERP